MIAQFYRIAHESVLAKEQERWQRQRIEWNRHNRSSQKSEAANRMFQDVPAAQ
jgi:hypothetical protein